jgi:F420-dependent oxidoreductase-like protein
VFVPTKEQGTVEAVVQRIQEIADLGFPSVWMPQSVGYDPLTLLAVAGRQVESIELGTAIVPTYLRHPAALAAQALTASEAVAGRLSLGIGVSHKPAMEGRFGIPWERPAQHMDDYLSVLLPLLANGRVDFAGELATGRVSFAMEEPATCPVYLAALQPRMLTLAGARADGTITWCTGPITLSEQVVPAIMAAAAGAGRRAPRVVVALPVCVTDDEAHGRAQADAQLDGYGQLPVYRAVLDREGVKNPGDVAVVGNEASVTKQLERLFSFGATDFVAIPCGSERDRRRTLDHLASVV